MEEFTHMALPRGLAIVVLLVGGCPLALAAAQTQPWPAGEAADIIQRFQLWDAVGNDGLGRSDRKTSGELGWGESRFLRDYMRCYFVTRDTYWLDKVVDHFDRMVAAMSDPDGDGYLGWQSIVYSVGIVEAAAVGDAGGATIAPALQRPYVKRGGGAVTGHEYEIVFTSSTEVVVRDVTAGKVLATLAYKPKQIITAVPGAKLTIAGAPKAGAKFRVRTTAPEWMGYQVHDGMILYPVAQFIEAVYTTDALHERYLAKARTYAALIEKHFLEKWEATWVDLGDGTGVYKFTKHRTQRFPDTSLPHNQYLALARAWLVMQAIPGVAKREVYRDRATKMARYFKKHLHRNGDAYRWGYWDPLPTEQVKSHKAEDIGHGSIDIGFALEAVRRGIVLANDDLKRMASTYVDVMWNKDREKPEFSFRVDGSGKRRMIYNEWIGLARVDARIWPLAEAMYAALKRPPNMGPQFVALYDALAGVRDEDRAECRRYSQQLVKLLAEGKRGVANPSFELGTPGTDRVGGWYLGAWNPDQGGKAMCVKGGYKSEQAVALIGKGPIVNVLAMTRTPLQIEGPRVCHVAAWYRTEGGAGPYLSVIGRDAKRKQVQYDHSAKFPPSTEWRRAEWTVPVKEGVKTLKVLLRNGTPGTVYWDDVRVRLSRVEEAQQPKP